MAYRTLVIVCALTLTAAGCAPRTEPGTPARRYDRTLISREELAQRAFDNMHSAVSSLRSDWLRHPLSGSVAGTVAAPPTIYLDGRRIGELDMLKSFSAESVERARYYTATEAQNRFGTAVSTPVIELISRGRTP